MAPVDRLRNRTCCADVGRAGRAAQREDLIVRASGPASDPTTRRQHRSLAKLKSAPGLPAIADGKNVAVSLPGKIETRHMQGAGLQLAKRGHTPATRYATCPNSRFTSGGVSTVTCVPNPPVATLTKVRPLTRPRSIGVAVPSAIAIRPALRSAIGNPQPWAKSLAVPSGRMPTAVRAGNPASATPPTTSLMVPSPPAATTRVRPLVPLRERNGRGVPGLPCHGNADRVASASHFAHCRAQPFVAGDLAVDDDENLGEGCTDRSSHFVTILQAGKAFCNSATPAGVSLFIQ